MKKTLFSVAILFLFSCSKEAAKPRNNEQAKSQNCQYQNDSVISYSKTILPLFQNNCKNCHSTPGSGGINLDSYSSIKQLMLGGQLMPVVTNTDTTAIIMPPPPQRHLDACNIKALTFWMAQGCLNN